MNTTTANHVPAATGHATYEPRTRQQPAYWRLEPTAPLVLATGVLPQLDADADRAIESGDPADLLMVLAEAVEGGYYRIAGRVAAAALDLPMNVLPAISAARLHATAIAGAVLAETSIVADLAAVAAELRRAAVMHEIGFGITSRRADPESLRASLDDARQRTERLAQNLERIARGERTQLVPTMADLSFSGLVHVIRGIAGLTTFANGVSPHEVTLAAQLRHRVGPAQGLRAQLAIIERDPRNAAARNSACACLVSLGRYEEALDHLAVSLLQPDRYVGNTGRRALREAGYRNLSGYANELAHEMGDRLAWDATPRARLLATRILVGTGRRPQAELSMTGLASATSASFVFERRARLDDRVTAGGAR